MRSAILWSGVVLAALGLLFGAPSVAGQSDVSEVGMALREEFQLTHAQLAAVLKPLFDATGVTRVHIAGALPGGAIFRGECCHLQRFQGALLR